MQCIGDVNASLTPALIAFLMNSEADKENLFQKLKDKNVCIWSLIIYEEIYTIISKESRTRT